LAANDSGYGASISANARARQDSLVTSNRLVFSVGFSSSIGLSGADGGNDPYVQALPSSSARVDFSLTELCSFFLQGGVRGNVRQSVGSGFQFGNL